MLKIGVVIMAIVVSICAIPIFRGPLEAANLPWWLATVPLLIVFAALLFAFVMRMLPAKAHSDGPPPVKRPSVVQDAVLGRNTQMPLESDYKERFYLLLHSLLDDNWSLFSDVPLPNSDETIDAVLVGNTGVYALQLNTDSGNYRMREGMWEWQDWHSRWRIDPKDPLAAMQRKRVKLDYLLSNLHTHGQVNGRLVWAGTGHVSMPEGSDDVWFTDDGGDSIWQDLHRGRIIPPQKIREICAVIEGLTHA